MDAPTKTSDAHAVDASPTFDRRNAEKHGLRQANVSKLFRFLGATADDENQFNWSNVEKADYKPADDSWRGVSRRVFVGETGESALFHFRYFEIERGGYTTLEQHEHEHCVMIIRGRGQVLIGCDSREVGFGDIIYVAPNDAHQFRNDNDDEPFGFTCVVNAVRDRPRNAEAGFCPICE